MNRPLKQLLETWRVAGLTHLPHPSEAVLARMTALTIVAMEVVPVQDQSSPELSVAATVIQDVQSPPATVVEASVTSAVRPMGAAEAVPPGEIMPEERPTDRLAVHSALSREQRIQALSAVAGRVAACQKCQELASTRTQTVFGVGNPEARVMFIGEAPGADEDRQGEPFVGKAGQLLNKIIAACGWQRDDLYICNILRCRPPGNRTPEKVEADHCREFLESQIQIVNPDYIVCWGSCAAQNLLSLYAPIGKLRQQWFSFGRAKVLCTYHPSYLLRNEEAKKPVWEDMKLLLADMGQTPPR